VLVDTVGDNGVVERLFEQLTSQPHIVFAGFLGHDGRIDIQMLRKPETTLHCPSGWAPGRMRETLSLLASGDMYVSPLITHRMDAGLAPNAYAMILEKKHGVLGVLLEWN
jgi:3-hydroxyethyl bacteriochlorophyllide a dehydrogenase